MIEKIADTIKKERDFIVATHVQPDGDAIGALLALGFLLKGLGKNVTLAAGDHSEIPAQYRWLPGQDLIKSGAPAASKVLIALDVANASRLGASESLLAKCPITINIDHHPDNPGFADLNWVEPGLSSASEMVFDLWSRFDLPLTIDAATCIYVGMLTDTGRWQYSNASSRALRIAAELVDLGVVPVEIFNRIYENYSPQWFKLLAVGLEKAVFDTELGLAYTIINQLDQAKTGASLAESENLVEWLRSVTGITVSMVLKEMTRGDIKVSLRSRDPIDVGAVARRFGGGGHKNASGFISREAPETIIKNIKQCLTVSS